MDQDQKVLQYEKRARDLDADEFRTIREFYANWEFGDEINLNHRFISSFIWDRKGSVCQWLRLDKYFNKRRISNQQLGGLIRKMIDKGKYPMRIFQSVSEWLDPRAVTKGNQKVRMISSGFVVFENDDNLRTSIMSAQSISKLVDGKILFVYSGNISVHCWWLDFDPRQFIEVTDAEFYFKREYFDRVARYNVYSKYNRMIPYNLDKRVTIDSRRIVPIINSLNVMTMNKVQSIDIKGNPDEIIAKLY